MRITLTADVGPIEQTGNENYRKGAQVDFPMRHARWLLMRDLAVEGWGPVAPLADVAPPVQDVTMHYGKLTVAQLRKLAEERGIGTSGLRKAELVEALEQ